MVVLCGNPRCGAVLRIGVKPRVLDVVLCDDAEGPYFTCPRCHVRNPVPERRRMPRSLASPHACAGPASTAE